MKKVQNLVADAGAFILNCPLQDYGNAIYTLPDVINEIKDEKTRNLLQVMPYELKYREPTQEDVKFVAYFAKKTGDFSQLSVTDIRLLALTVRLEKEINKGINLRENPEIKVFQTKNFDGPNVKDLELFNIQNHKSINTEKIDDQKNFDEQKDFVIDDNDGWITEDNVEEIKEKIQKMKFEDDNELMEDEELTVACITGDFAMQNILMQMGLNVISPKDGLHIKQTRQYVLRCHACARINPPSATQFCKHCGNFRTLKRVAVTINKDGSLQLHINFKKPIRIRGTRYSLPLPRGGKYANNPILCEDQCVPQKQKSKMAIEEKKLMNMQTILTDPEYLMRSNPFAINDVYSRASRMPKEKKWFNPNETRKPTGNKKKKRNI